MSERFEYGENGDGKELIIRGPWDLDVTVNFDDVNHSTVEKEVRRLVSLLNKHWTQRIVLGTFRVNRRTGEIFALFDKTKLTDEAMNDFAALMKKIS